MNVSSCSDSSSLAEDGISSSAEAIISNNRKNSIPRHSTPSKTGLRFIVANDDSDPELNVEKTAVESEITREQPVVKAKCETTFSRTTFANTAGYPNCGTFYVQHISEDEAVHEDMDNGNLMDENENSSSAYASPNSIRKLVSGAEQLVYLNMPIDDSDVDYRSQVIIVKNILD